MILKLSLTDRLLHLFLFAISILCLRGLFSFAVPSFSAAIASAPLLRTPPSLPASGLMHNMSDDELMARALSIDGHDDPSSSYKVAFMFLALGPLPLAPVWDMFFKGYNGLFSVYVHPHPSYNDSVPPESAFYGKRIPSQWDDCEFFEWVDAPTGHNFCRNNCVHILQVERDNYERLLQSKDETIGVLREDVKMKTEDCELLNGKLDEALEKIEVYKKWSCVAIAVVVLVFLYIMMFG